MKRTAKKLALIPGLVIGMGFLSPVAFAQSACSIDYQVVSQWGSGSTNKIVVKHDGPPLSQWQLTWDFSGSEKITSMYNGAYTQTGASVVVKNVPWNGNLGTGASVEIGFGLSSLSGVTPKVLFNGVDCNAGTTDPDTDPDNDNAVAIYSLSAENSVLNFVTTKNNHVVESHRFDRLSGGIFDDGVAKLEIDLASVNTNNTTRDERMRSMLFETGTFPKAVVRLGVDLNMIAALKVGEKAVLNASATLDLHGVVRNIITQLSVQRLSASRIMVQNVSPLLLTAGDYSLEQGIEALKTAASLGDISRAVPADFILFYDAL